MAKFNYLILFLLVSCSTWAENHCQLAQQYLTDGQYYSARDSYRQYLQNRISDPSTGADQNCGPGFYQRLRDEWYDSVLNQTLALCDQATEDNFAGLSGQWDLNLARLNWLKPTRFISNELEKKIADCKLQWDIWLTGKNQYLKESSSLEIVLSNCYLGLEILDGPANELNIAQAETSLRVASVSMHLLGRPTETLTLPKPFSESLKILRIETKQCLKLLADGINALNH